MPLLDQVESLTRNYVDQLRNEGTKEATLTAAVREIDKQVTQKLRALNTRAFEPLIGDQKGHRDPREVRERIFRALQPRSQASGISSSLTSSPAATTRLPEGSDLPIGPEPDSVTLGFTQVISEAETPVPAPGPTAALASSETQQPQEGRGSETAQALQVQLAIAHAQGKENAEKAERLAAETALLKEQVAALQKELRQSQARAEQAPAQIPTEVPPPPAQNPRDPESVAATAKQLTELQTQLRQSREDRQALEATNQDLRQKNAALSSETSRLTIEVQTAKPELDKAERQKEQLHTAQEILVTLVESIIVGRSPKNFLNDSLINEIAQSLKQHSSEDDIGRITARLKACAQERIGDRIDIEAVLRILRLEPSMPREAFQTLLQKKWQERQAAEEDASEPDEAGEPQPMDGPVQEADPTPTEIQQAVVDQFVDEAQELIAAQLRNAVEQRITALIAAHPA